MLKKTLDISMNAAVQKFYFHGKVIFCWKTNLRFWPILYWLLPLKVLEHFFLFRYFILSGLTLLWSCQPDNTCSTLLCSAFSLRSNVFLRSCGWLVICKDGLSEIVPKLILNYSTKWWNRWKFTLFKKKMRVNDMEYLSYLSPEWH